jgi:hypothetical protein
MISMSFETHHPWHLARPHTLVVACSDGRLQQAVDEFLNDHLGISEYDRLYLPGGPGALASSGLEFSRSERQRREFRFLLTAHEIEKVFLVFHGPLDAGPKDAICADYGRALGDVGIQRVRAEQERDAKEILERGFGFLKVDVRVYFCEVAEDFSVSFREFKP